MVCTTAWCSMCCKCCTIDCKCHSHVHSKNNSSFLLGTSYRSGRRIVKWAVCFGCHCIYARRASSSKIKFIRIPFTLTQHTSIQTQHMAQRSAQVRAQWAKNSGTIFTSLWSFTITHRTLIATATRDIQQQSTSDEHSLIKKIQLIPATTQ